MKLGELKPIVFFDLETTGTNVQTDRIVELSVVKIMPSGERISRVRRLNPEMHIPEAASKVHHIYDEDVANEPAFKNISHSFFQFLEGCDLGGYNIVKFDIPVLTKEFWRAGLHFSIEGRDIVDAYTIFCRMEPRSLTAAYKFFCGKHLDGAHGALADTMATVEVLEAQLAMYTDPNFDKFPEGMTHFPTEMSELTKFCRSQNPEWIDANGRFKWFGNEPVVAFSKYAGTPLRQIAAENPGFLRWVIQADFTDDVKKIANDALVGIFPEKQSF